ncbi:glycoside hydrolase family 2 sugar binding protein [Pseudopedobacter saltans DSM 12145]|uniref:beta-galactosidase n=1 Tax=Pseudopedobacter saltans (strain ATCC 51119 / DSM 12145 / JCM 21818 / CCUG 39354 / LMG 10337 / NBRC 100064 / NCIMB 13643) TaxID=762903 RepID=F0S4E9_PSESL|nr:glycoside hydrolase family 2 [Pseudopedobacter saltans]ADY50906.1 glycoside hydrolase family 2 sugar binding protein [Pseudopedobacter saltans DSM 12145]
MKLNAKIALSLLFLGTTGLQVSAQTTETQYLSGKGKDDGVLWDFFVTEGMNAGNWTQIPVPSNWELKGFGKYNYGFNKEANKGKEEGLYKYKFKVADDWKDKIVNIVFEGSMTDTEVKINGKLAGEIHQGSFYVFKYDISKLIKFGEENLLEVKVAKHSANKSVNAAEREGDFWIFGGIFRPVYLEGLPQNHIERVSLDAKADGSFRSKILTEGDADEVAVQLFDAQGKKFGKRLKTKLSGKENWLNTSFANPKLWSAEFPNLYKAQFTLLKNGKVQHQLEQKFGFRTVEVKERDGVYINGVKIKFKGVNRHSFHPESGRTTSKEISIGDVKLMKEMNMNAVRMAHYPPDNHFLAVCDSLGLYVMNELGGWHGHYDTPTGSKLLKEMMVVSENNPSIIFWANGNEGGHNAELDHIFFEQDIQKRPLIYPWAVYGGFETTHYREYNYGIGTYDHGHNIVMPTEFLHGMFDGGHGAGLEDYWKAMLANPLAAGGFLWDFQDQGVVRTDKNGIIDTDGNHGPDGIVGPYYEKEGSFFTIKEVWSPIFFEKREMTKGFDGSFHIENRYSFTNTNQCTFSYELKKLGNYNEVKESKKGSITAPNIKAGDKGVLKANLPQGWTDFDVLYITAKDVNQQELFTWSFPISLPNKVAKSLIKEDGQQNIAIQETANSFVVKANGITYQINKTTGLLEQVQNAKGVIPFKNGPVLQEAVNNYKNFKLSREEGKVVIASTFDRKESYNTLRWEILPSGQLKMHVQYFPEAYFTRFVGVNFDFPEDQIKGVEYMGMGPYRVWKNRMKGNQFGVWKKDYNDTATGEIPFRYPEFKGYHSNMYWTKFIGKDQSFKVFTDREDVFLRLYTPKEQKDTDWKNMEPTFPKGDISFMNGISGIGTKTQKPETTGPMGMKHVYYDFEKEPIRALHMVLYFDFM